MTNNWLILLFSVQLEFIYSNRIKHPDLFTVQDALEMLSSASMWLVTGLRDYCEEILTTQGKVEVGEAIQLYLYAEECGAPRFKKMIVRMMSQNREAIRAHPDVGLLPKDLLLEL